MSLFRMPSLGADMEAGTLVEWLRQPGDKVKRGDVVAVVETQKGAIEIEIFEDGILTKHLIQLGTKVPVGTPLAELDGVSEMPQQQPTPAPAPSPPATPPTQPTVAPAAATPSPTPPAPPPVQPAITPAAATPSPVSVVAELKVSPAARKLAADHGIDLATVRGSGPEGAIVFVDVEQALKMDTTAQPKAPRRLGIDLGEMRKAIAAAMSRSKREIPHYYLSHEIDAAAVLAWLAQANAQRPPAQRLLLGALLVKAAASAAKAFPEFNGFFTNGAFAPSDSVHVGMAIAIRGGGLIAPAVHDVHRLTVDQIMEKLRDLTDRVRGGRLRGSEIAGATITVSSLGDRGVDALYGIIYPPQVALVGFGSPREQPRASGGTVQIRPIVSATLAGDHRVSDGHRGALFLSKIAALLQTPETL